MMVSYAMRPLGCDPVRIKGMAERLIISHYENNYGGAVKRAKAATYVDTFMAAIRWSNADRLFAGLAKAQSVQR